MRTLVKKVTACHRAGGSSTLVDDNIRPCDLQLRKAHGSLRFLSRQRTTPCRWYLPREKLLVVEPKYGDNEANE